MLGFATEKKPKGPSQSTTKTYSLDLSGTQILFEMPDGNCKDLPNPHGKISPKINIYDQGIYEDLEIAPYVSVVSRSFCFSAFLDPRLGSTQFNVILRETCDKTVNLFKDDLPSRIIEDHKKSYESFNKRASIGIYPPKKLTSVKYNNRDWLYYEIDLQNEPYPSYSLVISEKHYITFGFRYLSMRDPNAPWCLMAKQLEKDIMSSVKVMLSPSTKAELEQTK